jgi:hypothetical protein
MDEYDRNLQQCTIASLERGKGKGEREKVLQVFPFDLCSFLYSSRAIELGARCEYEENIPPEGRDAIDNNSLKQRFGVSDFGLG